MPERAAKRRVERAYAQPIRPDGLMPCRPYERRVGESHRHVLQLLEKGLLTRGVLHDVPVSAVESSGWHLAYSAPYKHRTRDADLERVPQEARYVLVAAGKHQPNCDSIRGAGGLAQWMRRVVLGGVGSGGGAEARSVDVTDANGTSPASARPSAFALLAWGRRDHVLQITHPDLTRHRLNGIRTISTNVDDDVYWYRWEGHSFGFSSDPHLRLWPAYVGDVQPAALQGQDEEEASEDRLSWNLDLRSTGGWRAGRQTELGDSDEWHKMLYYRL